MCGLLVEGQSDDLIWLLEYLIWDSSRGEETKYTPISIFQCLNDLSNSLVIKIVDFYSSNQLKFTSSLTDDKKHFEFEINISCVSTERQQILKGVQNIVVKAARRRSKALEVDALRLPPPPSPLDPKKQKSSLSLSEAPPRGLPMRRGRQPSPELRHATSDDNLSSSTGEGPGLQVTWTRPHYRQVAIKNQTPREVDFEARRKKRRSRSFEVTGQAVSMIVVVLFSFLIIIIIIIMRDH